VTDAFDELRKASAERREQLEARAQELADEYDQWRAQPEVESESVAERDFSRGFRLLRERLDTSMQLLRNGALDRRLDAAIEQANAPAPAIPVEEAEPAPEPVMVPPAPAIPVEEAESAREPVMVPPAPAEPELVGVALADTEPDAASPVPAAAEAVAVLAPPAPVPPPRRDHRRRRRRPRVWLILANVAVVAVIAGAGVLLYNRDTPPKHAPIALAPPVSLVAPRIDWALHRTRVLYKGPPCSLTWHYRITLQDGRQYAGKPAIVQLTGPDYKRSLRRQISVSPKGTVEFDSAAPKCTNRDRNTVKLVSVANSANLRQSDS
jgi:hypothetical protein